MATRNEQIGEIIQNLLLIPTQGLKEISDLVLEQVLRFQTRLEDLEDRLEEIEEELKFGSSEYTHTRMEKQTKKRGTLGRTPRA